MKKGAKIMKVVVTSRERKLTERELKRRMKSLDVDARVLIRMTQIAQGRLFAARGEESNSGIESEEEWLRIMRAEESKN